MKNSSVWESTKLKNSILFIVKIVFNLLEIVFILGALLFLLVVIKTFLSSFQYADTLPRFQSITASSPKALLTTLIGDNEYFIGNASMKFLDLDNKKVQITIMNDQTGDDSVTAEEYVLIAEAKDQVWKITQAKIHWRCRSMMFFGGWTTKSCA